MGYFGLFWTNFNSYITNILNMTDFFNKKHTLLFNYKFGTPAKKPLFLTCSCALLSKQDS